MEKNHTRLKEELRQNNIDLNSLKDNSTHLKFEIDANTKRLKQHDETLIDMGQTQKNLAKDLVGGLELFNTDLEVANKNHERLKAEVAQYNNHIGSMKEDIAKHKSDLDITLRRIKEHDQVEV